MGNKVGHIFGVEDRKIRRTVTHDNDVNFAGTYLAPGEQMILMEKARYVLFTSEDQVALELGLQPKDPAAGQ